MQQLEQNSLQPLALLDTISEGVVVFDAGWHCTYANKKAEEFVAIEQEALLGKNIWELFPEAADNVFAIEMRRAVQENTSAHIEVYYPPLQKWFEGRLYPSIDGLILFFQDITARKETEAALQRNEELLRTLADTAPSMIWIADPDGTITFHNKQWIEYCGLSPEENASNWAELVLHPDDFERCVEAWQQALKSGSNYEIEVRNRRHDGVYRWFITRAVPVRDAAGNITAWFGSTTDIHEHRLMEEELEKYASIVSSTDDAIYSTALDGTIMSWNRSAESMFGYQAIEVVGQSARILIPENQLKQWESVMQRLRHGESVAHFETLRKTKCGDLLDVSISYSLLKGSAENLIGTAVVVRDITERRRAEKALHQSEARARRLIDSNIIGVVVADMQHILEANDAFLKLVGYTQEDVKEKRINWEAMTPSEFGALDQQALQELQARGVCTPYEKEYIRKDGSRAPILVGAALLDADVYQQVSFILDMTEFRALEQRKDEFIITASHELKTPITTLKGLTQLLIRKLERQGIQEEVPILKRMETQVDRLTRLIDELLDASKIQAGQLDYEKELVDLATIVHETVVIMQPIYPTHTLFVGDSSHAVVLGDKDRLGQVLTNLISNAVKYSPQANKVDILINTSKNRAIIRIQDYGVGISKVHQENIFDRFYRARDMNDKTFPGLGMGLYISNEIIKRHGGAITVASEKGKGSTFTVSLPLET